MILATATATEVSAIYAARGLSISTASASELAGWFNHDTKNESLEAFVGGYIDEDLRCGECDAQIAERDDMYH